MFERLLDFFGGLSDAAWNVIGNTISAVFTSLMDGLKYVAKEVSKIFHGLFDMIKTLFRGHEPRPNINILGQQLKQQFNQLPNIQAQQQVQQTAAQLIQALNNAFNLNQQQQALLPPAAPVQLYQAPAPFHAVPAEQQQLAQDAQDFPALRHE